MWQTVMSSQDKLEDSNEIESVEAVETPEESNEVQEDNTLSVSTLFLVIGTTPLRQCHSFFEQVYAQGFRAFVHLLMYPRLVWLNMEKVGQHLQPTVRQNGLPPM